MVVQHDIVAGLSIAKIKDTTVAFEAVVLDVHLERRGPAPLPVSDINEVVVSVEPDAVSSASGTIHWRGDEGSRVCLSDRGACGAPAKVPKVLIDNASS